MALDEGDAATAVDLAQRHLHRIVAEDSVERHLSNTYQKLGITGKSARTAVAAYLAYSGSEAGTAARS